MRHAAIRVSFSSLLVRRDQWDTYWGAKKNNFFNSRYRRRHHGGRAGGILSIRGPEVTRGAHRVGTRRMQTPIPHARAPRSVDTYQYRCLAVRGPQAQVLSVLDPELSGELQAPTHAGQATTDHQTYPERPPVTNIPTKKVVYLAPMAPRSRKKRQFL